MTYREAIQIQIQALQQVYDNAECLRDAATDEEKEVWNFLRRQLPDVWGRLQKLDNRLAGRRAGYELRGRYPVVSNSTE